MRRQSATDRRAGSGCITRIQAVDVEAQVNRPLAEMLFGFPDNGIDSIFVDPRTVHDIETERVIVGRPQADLYRVCGIDETFFRRMSEHRAMIDAPLFVFPGIAVRIEMQQR